MTSQPDAGTVHFAVVSVVPWEECAAELQPQFELTAEDALSRVFPITQSVADSQLAVARLFLGGARRGGSPDPDVDPGFDGDAIPNVDEAGRAPPDDWSPGGLDGTNGESLLGTSFGAAVDPLVQYQTAVALFQEVQLLNRYVAAAATRPDCDAYLMRLQVTLLPRVRGAAYDAYATFAFFATDGGGASAPRATGDRTDLTPTMLPDVAPGTAWVVPLMVTDSLEASLQSRARTSQTHVGLALEAFGGSGGGRLQSGSLGARHAEASGFDLNGLMTVARASDNAVRVRLGAAYHGSSGLAMIPRNHHVTLLLLVPRASGRDVEVHMRSEFVDAVSGESLLERSSEQLQARLDELIERHRLRDLEPEDVFELAAIAQRNDLSAFEQRLRNAFGPSDPAVRYSRALWLDLIELAAGGRYTSTTFRLPPARPSAQEEQAQGAR